jgi:hypothetical protein
MRLKFITRLLPLAFVALLLAENAAAQLAFPNVVEKGHSSYSPALAPDAASNPGGTSGAASPASAAGAVLPDLGGKPKALGVVRRIDPFEEEEGSPQFPTVAEDAIVCVAGCDGARGAVLHGKQ